MGKLLLVFLGLIAFILLCFGFYFFVISPEAAKPVVEKPAQMAEAGPAVVDERMLEYLLTELGAYKLHANSFSGDLPEFELMIAETQQKFAAVVKNNAVRVRQGSAESPDARITLNADAVLFLSSAANDGERKARAAQLLREREQRGLNAELLAGKGDLLLKGYLALYDENKDTIAASGLTGSAVAELPLHASSVAGFMVIIVVLWGALAMRLAFSRRH